MSLSKSVLAIVDDMENSVKELEAANESISFRLLLNSYTKQFRKAIKEDFENLRTKNAVFPDHRTMIEKAKAEFRKEKAGLIVPCDNSVEANNSHSHLLAEDKAEGIATYLVGGTEDGDLLMRNPEMPMNAHLEHLGNVYTLAEDGKLHFNEEQTRRLQSQRVKG